jgi:hypothetical protein
MPVVQFLSEQDCAVPTPVRFPAPGELPKGQLYLVGDGGLRTPLQRDGEQLAAVLPTLAAKKPIRARIEAGKETTGVSLKDDSNTAVSILINGAPFTTYHFDPAEPRPYCYPVYGPGGRAVTRNFPMKDLDEEKATKDQDHPHHRSFWTAFDETNGVNNWSEEKGKHGWTKHQKFEAREEGPVFAGFTAFSTWTSHPGQPLVDERRRIRVYNVGQEVRLVDYEIQLIANHGQVEYGDTKEGGILAFRVFHTMKEAQGGRMENNHGGSGEKACWGKRAAWLDYHGPVAGEILGIAMMDHPGNLNHPCRWHTRAYGLVGTNPFSTSAFEPTQPKTPYLQKPGETLRFRYRVLIHRGDAKQGHVDDAYHAWVQPPQVRVG